MKTLLSTAVLCGLMVAAVPAAQAQELKVISYNIHHGYDAAENPRVDSLAKLIKQSGADLVGLQEVDSLCARSGQMDQARRLAELTGMHYAYARHFAWDGGSYGLGILSRFPLSRITNHRLPFRRDTVVESRALLTAVATLPGKREVTFAVVHYSGAERLLQSEVTRSVLELAGMPVILTGDLNSVPTSAVVANLRRSLKDTNLSDIETVGDANPQRKIDYVFVDAAHPWEVLEEKVFHVDYSDHLPLMVTLRLGK